MVVLSGESSKRKRSAYEDSEELFENFTASYNELAVHFMELQKHLKTRLDAAIKTSADQADTIAKQVKDIADQHTKIKRQEEIINEREAELSSAQSARDDAENRLHTSSTSRVHHILHTRGLMQVHALPQPLTVAPRVE